MNILEKIVKDKKAENHRRLQHIKAGQLLRTASDTRMPRDFLTALRAPRLAVIAEVKKASPSKGVIRPDFDPVAIAESYAAAGADCISVLTEETYFQGKPFYLKDIHSAVGIPILRKDFIFDKRQIRESYDLGADAILLIAAILSNEQLSELSALANDFGLMTLVEVHTEKELQRVLDQNCRLIGINNRNLMTFETDLHHSIELRKRIPDDITCVSESGIQTSADCELLWQNGFNAVLVGESLMRQSDPGAYLSKLLGRMS